jgi:FkbM family methyltransferase
MKTSLKRATKNALRALGIEVHRTGMHPDYGLENFFPLLRRLGLKPKHIVDVGANHGSWTRHAIRYFPWAAYTLIEPQANLKAQMQDLIDQGYKITWISAGCSNEPGQLQLMLCHRDDSSTFIQEDRHGKKITGPSVAVPMTTLNQIVATAGMPEMVKIDAEGYDLKVLEGASNLFGNTEIFLSRRSGLRQLRLINGASDRVHGEGRIPAHGHYGHEPMEFCGCASWRSSARIAR